MSCEIKWFSNPKIRLSEDEPTPKKDPFNQRAETHPRQDITNPRIKRTAAKVIHRSIYNLQKRPKSSSGKVIIPKTLGIN